MNKFSMGTVIAIVVPLATALLLGVIVFGQTKRRDTAKFQERQLSERNTAISRLIDEIDVRPLMDKTIALELTADEQAAFLTQLRVNAAAAGAQLTRYTNRGFVVQNKPEKPTERDLFRPVASSVEVEGTYAAVRAFAYSLLRANRLMNMNGVSWKRDPTNNTTTLSFTLVRYVTDPAPRPIVASTAGGSGEVIR